MKLNFVINDIYLIVHTLSIMTSDRFSSKKYRKEIVAFQNFAWENSRTCYDFLVARFCPESWVDYSIEDLTDELPKYIAILKKCPSFQLLLTQTHDYLKKCQKQWAENYEETLLIMKDLTKLDFEKAFTIFITHPGLRNGCYLGGNKQSNRQQIEPVIS